MVPCPVFPPPPWDGGGMMPLWWCIYIPTYLHTYVHTYIPLHYLTLPYRTLHYLTLHSIHTYLHTYIHTYIPYLTLHYLTNIPTYQHTTTTGHRGGDQKNHTTTTGHRGGGTRRTIPPPQATGGGAEEPDDTVHPYPLVGGEGGWPTLHHIYYHILPRYFSSALQRVDLKGLPHQPCMVTKQIHKLEKTMDRTNDNTCRLFRKIHATSITSLEGLITLPLIFYPSNCRKSAWPSV